MTDLHVYVSGAPKGQPRARHVPAGKGKVRVVSTMDPKIAAYRIRMIAIMKHEAKAAGWAKPKLAQVDVIAYYATKDHAKRGQYCGKKPDRDNIDKLILDCAQEAKLIGDDATVAAGAVTKLWSALGGVQIAFRSLDGVSPQQDDDDDTGALTDGSVGGIDREPVDWWSNTKPPPRKR